MASLFLSRALLDRLPAAMASPRLLWRAEAGLLRLIWGISRLLPVDAASALGAATTGLIGPRLGMHEVVLENLAIALPELDGRSRQSLAKGIWRNAGRIMAEYAHLDRIVAAGAGRLEIVRLDLAHRPAGQPVFYVSAHIANWDILDVVVADDTHPASIVATPQRNPFVEAAIQRMRQARKCGASGRCRVITSKGAIREIMRDLAQGRNIGWLLDQRHKKGEPVPFFGHPAATATIPAALALRAQCPLVPIQVERLAGCRFRITVHPPLSTAGLDELSPNGAALEMTRRLNALFEQWITAHPDQWLCLKRRWPRGTGGPKAKKLAAKAAERVQPKMLEEA